ncbi:cytochrome c biogenesis heme-transporting ATPase CcmA [Thiomicrorhabdus heinhorstiae]|uniref:Cytochrome c biogenesis heme-transporting ATPase CcmA n=1 Tax=Thiomicrorhabdus heinhorstiae TaxID=2748010 RepID=A0ABS0BWM2_9GAMM|nr:cytochrome c biogenesis heme-transporting ATPase CcmA [Thiomicrorhabdus heinhorstiae]MBF6058203.1 cytochrome c biogenesis heme-transporting ATPase CcmA [Thiomicrorhabdus heinhorstiae]
MHYQAKQLSCKRGRKTLFSELSFELQAGQLLLIEGHNGAGKTSLLKLLTGLRMPEAGEILWQSRSIHDAHNDFRSKLSWLGHQNPLKDEQSALENLHTLSSFRPRNSISLTDALQEVKLGHAKHAQVKTFSAGMKRRLSLASLLVANTQLWILDEPQAALDKDGVALYESLAKQHLENDGMIVMTSHHPLNLPADRVQRLALGV